MNNTCSLVSAVLEARDVDRCPVRPVYADMPGVSSQGDLPH